MEKEKVYLSSELPVEERVEDLLGRMTLEEKVGQLKARAFPYRRIFFEPFEGLSEDQRKRLGDLIMSMFFDFEKRDIMDSLSANYWKKHWKEVALEEENMV